MASINPPTPRICISRCMLYALTCTAIPVPTCLSVGIAMGQLVAGGEMINVVRRYIDEVVLAEAAFREEPRGHWLRQINCKAGLLAGHNFLAAIVAAIGYSLDGLGTNRCACLL